LNVKDGIRAAARMRLNMIKLDSVLSRVHFVSRAPCIAWTWRSSAAKLRGCVLAVNIVRLPGRTSFLSVNRARRSSSVSPIHDCHSDLAPFFFLLLNECFLKPRRLWRDHSEGRSRRRVTPIPCGSRPSVAALTRSGARKASEWTNFTSAFGCSAEIQREF